MEGRLLICCQDQRGIVSAVSAFLFEQGANITHSDQHSTDPEGGLFFMRIAFHLEGLADKWHDLTEKFLPIAESFKMEWKITTPANRKRVAIFVSKEDHCLQDLLYRWQTGELDADIPLVISNHTDMEELVTSLGIPYHHIPVVKGQKEEATRQHLELLEKERIDSVILARYMQIIPGDFIEKYRNQMINIHHSFLPAFVGGNPYSQAYQRGVKIIGATAHYVTEELDQGPIIEQDVERVDHRLHIPDLKNVGRDIERMVLARAVKWHLDDKILVYGNKTVVFR